jgi:regulator of cell morphogenesis and NO signaling
MSTTLTPTTPVGRLAAEAPLATRVLARHGIDYCCGGGVPLADACAARGLSVESVLAEIHRELVGSEGVEGWTGAPLDALIDHILSTYHRPLDQELPRIDAMARKVLGVHGDKDPQRLRAIVSTFAALKAELEQHMRKEEVILFPMIRQGHGPMAEGPIAVMQMEHDEAAVALRRLRELTDDFTVPEGACNTWRALWHALADFERAMHEHVHLENEVLFPRALGVGPVA